MIRATWAVASVYPPFGFCMEKPDWAEGGNPMRDDRLLRQEAWRLDWDCLKGRTSLHP